MGQTERSHGVKRWSLVACVSALALLLLLPLAAVAKPKPATTVYRNGYVWTVDNRRPRAQAVAVRGAKIVFVGSNKAAKAFIGKKTKVVNLKGRMMMPGLIDSHQHPIEGGASLIGYNLNGVQRTIPELQAVLQGWLDASDDQEPDGWLDVELEVGGELLDGRRTAQHLGQLPLGTGDLVDGGYANITLDDEWGDWHLAAGFIASEVPVVATPGNHEFYDPKDRQKRNLNMFWRPGFTLPENGPAGLEETAYSFDYQGVRFIMVSSDQMLRDEAIARSQTEWVESLLKNNPCKWTVMAFHHPFFSTAARRNNKVVRENLKPLVDRYGVDLVLNGHDHTYARGVVMPDGAEQRGRRAGTVYVVSVSGSKQYSQDAAPWWEAGYTNTQLWQAITIDGNRLIYKAFDASGALADQFMLTKMKNGSNRIGLPPEVKTR